MLRKSSSKVIMITCVNSIDPDPPPIQPVRLQPIERVDSVAVNRSVVSNRGKFLDATRADICSSFLRGVAEHRITEQLGGRRQNVCRLDIESAVREGFQIERQQRLDAERALRMYRRAA